MNASCLVAARNNCNQNNKFLLQMPPTLGRLVPSAENVVSRESSPIKSGGGGGGIRMSNAQSASDFQHFANRVDGRHHHPAYGRSQDDLNLTPRSHYTTPIMGLGLSSGLAENWSGAGGFNRAGIGGGGGYLNQLSRGQTHEFFASNGSGSGGNAHQRSGLRPLQHMHSRDDLDALRPRKTRRTGPSFDQDDQNGQIPTHAFLSMSPRSNDNGLGAEGGFMGERGGYLNTAAVYATPDEVPPAAPRRLVSRHSTPSRPERSSANNAANGNGEGDEAGKRGGHRMTLADPLAIDADGMPTGGLGGGGGVGVCASQGFQLAKHGYYAAMSPVTVASGRGVGFSGGRRHHRHSSNGTGHGSSGDFGVATSQWRMGEVSPEEPAVLLGDSPSSSRSGGGGGSTGGGGVMGVGGLGLTAHAMSRMEQVCVFVMAKSQYHLYVATDFLSWVYDIIVCLTRASPAAACVHPRVVGVLAFFFVIVLRPGRMRM